MLVGRGRRRLNHPIQVVEQRQSSLTVMRQESAIQQVEKLAGWWLYVTNAKPEQMLENCFPFDHDTFPISRPSLPSGWVVSCGPATFPAM